MEPLDDGYGAVLADGTKARLDIFVFAPIESFCAIKLRAMIENDMLRQLHFRQQLAPLLEQYRQQSGSL